MEQQNFNLEVRKSRRLTFAVFIKMQSAAYDQNTVAHQKFSPPPNEPFRSVSKHVLV